MEADTTLFRASHRFARIAPRKARPVMDLIRGKSAEDALTVLRFSLRRASPMISKVLRSAMANATQVAGLEGEDLVVWQACVDDGPRERRWRPRAMGRVYPRIRRRCHLSVVLKQAPREGATIARGAGRRAASTQPKAAEGTDTEGQ